MSRSNKTLSDVAAMAGVSMGTVSKYLKNPESVKERNRKAIAGAIEVLQYIPNTLAQSLARGRTNTILLYLIIEETIHVSTWLHALPLIRTFTDHLHGTGYGLQIKIGFINDPDTSYKNILDSINGKMIDGIAVLTPWKLPERLLQLLIGKDLPFILIDSHTDLPESNEIYSDNVKITMDLVDYMAERGHKKIGYIHVDNQQQHMSDRLNGFMAGMEKHGLTIHKNYILTGDFSIESGYNCVMKLIKNGNYPTAIICGNDNMAAGAMRAIQSEGLNVPDDISLAGIDNSIVAQAVHPQLTTVDASMDDIGGHVIKNLLAMVRDPLHKTGKIVIPHRLIEGKTVKKNNE